MLIEDTATLEDFCDRVRGAPTLSLDTEFLWERTYSPRLCLVQVGSGQDFAAVDVLSPKLDPEPLWELLDAPDQLKILHAASNDLRVLYDRRGALLPRVFDTQVAAAMLGHGHQIAYAALVKKLLRRTLDKSSQRTDWSRRPLSRRQLVYAIDDVAWLGPIHERLHSALVQRGRDGWLTEDMEALLDEELYRFQPEEAWRRLPLARVQGSARNVARALAGWRERAARRLDRPRGHVISDDALLELARAAPTRVRDLAGHSALGSALRSDADRRELLASIQEGLEDAEGPSVPTPRRTRRATRDALVALLQAVLKQRCEELDIASALIINRAELERLASGDEAGVGALSGWRYEVFGRQALDLRDGHLTLRWTGDQLEAVRHDAAPARPMPARDRTDTRAPRRNPERAPSPRRKPKQRRSLYD